MQEPAIEIRPGEVDVARMHRFLALYTEAWAQPTTGRLAELWAPDAEMMHPELDEPIRGRDEVMTYLRWFLEMAPDLTVRPLAAAANGDTIFIHFRSEATIAGRNSYGRASAATTSRATKGCTALVSSTPPPSDEHSRASVSDSAYYCR
jgi:hypothetical protein